MLEIRNSLYTSCSHLVVSKSLLLLSGIPEFVSFPFSFLRIYPEKKSYTSFHLSSPFLYSRNATEYLLDILGEKGGENKELE